MAGREKLNTARHIAIFCFKQGRFVAAAVWLDFFVCRMLLYLQSFRSFCKLVDRKATKTFSFVAFFIV
jgi:hypothetical protein